MGVGIDTSRIYNCNRERFSFGDIHFISMGGKEVTDKEKLYKLIYDALETHELSLSELMEVFFAILMEQELFMEDDVQEG